MKTKTTYRVLALFGLLTLAACDQAGTDPLFDGLTPEEALELSVLEDEGSFDVAVELNSVANDVAGSLGVTTVTEGRDLNMEARTRFAAAREALRAGDRRRALEEARDARRLITRAVLATGGVEAVEALLERIEDLAASAESEDDDVFDDPDALADELRALADAARDRFMAGDVDGAGERALLGEQRARYRRGRLHHRGDVRPARARLAVALAETAVRLAERIIEASDVPVRDAVTDVADHQNRWLMHAHRMLERARTALENGHFARAVHFAQHAHWSALKAVILPGGITEPELRAMVELADHLYAEAQASLGDEPSELEQRLLQRAGRLIELGKKMLEEGYVRGVAPLWKASVICAWLLH